MNIKQVLGITLLAGVILTAGILIATQRTNSPDGRLQAATTFYPLYEFTKAIGGDKITVTNLTPAGTEPHDFEPSPQALAELQRAKVFVYNGGSFEPWVEKFLPDYKNTAVNAAQNIQLLEAEGSQDPHFWLDPQLAATAIQNIRDALIKAAPEYTGYFTKNAADYTAKLNDLAHKFEHDLAACASRTFITAHDAFTYIAKRYNLELIPIAGINPEAEPSPAKLAEITQIVRQKNVGTIFFEQLASPQLADTIAKETGTKTAVLDPIEGLTHEDQQQGKTYLSIQADNLAALRAALGCQETNH